MKPTVLVILLLAATACSSPSGDGDVTTRPELELSDEPVTLQFLGIAEWSGQIDASSVRVGKYRADFGQAPRYSAGHKINLGGAEALSWYFKRDEADFPNATLVLAPGDSFGVSPPLSSSFEEEPSVISLNLMGLDFDTFGNHNFNKGLDHLQRMIELADYQYVAANLAYVPQNLRGVAPFAIRILDGVPVAVIAVVDQDTPELVFPGSFGTMAFTDALEGALEARAMAKEAGATVFILLAHLWDEVAGEEGNLIPLVRAIEAREPGAFAFVLGDTASKGFACTVQGDDSTPTCSYDNYDTALSATFAMDTTGELIVHNRNRGTGYSRVRIEVVPRTGQVLSREVSFIAPEATSTTVDPAIAEAIQPFREELDEAKGVIICVAEGQFTVEEDIIRTREVAAGNLVTDAIYEYSQPDLVVLNSGGYRDSIPAGTYSPQDPTLRRPNKNPQPPWDVVRGDIDAILPFLNFVVELQVDSEQIFAMLENSVNTKRPEDSGAFLQISGFRFWYDSSKPDGSKVCKVELDDQTVLSRTDTRTLYKLATIDFLAQGGDGYEMLSRSQGFTREQLADVVVKDLQRRGTIDPDDFYTPLRPRIIDVAGVGCPRD